MFIQLRSSDEDHKNVIEQGFTLIELLVVIVILGILAAVVLFALGGLDSSAKKNSCSTEAATVQTAIAAFRAAHPTVTLGGTGGTASQQRVMADLTQATTLGTTPQLDGTTAIQPLMQSLPKQDSANGYWYTTASPAFSAASTTAYWQIQNPGNSATVVTSAGCTQ